MVVTWRRRQMETFPALLALCEGNPLVTLWIPLIKATDAGLWCFLWSAPEPTADQTFKTPVIWDPSRSLWRHWNELFHSLIPMNAIVFILYAVVRTLCWRHSSKCKRVQVNEIFSESFRLSDAYIYIYIYIYVSKRDHSEPRDYMKEYWFTVHWTNP